jgi:hypothetical protein
MVYRATEEIVRRVMPLLERLSTRTIDRAVLLQYLSAGAGIDWGVLELIDQFQDGDPDFGGLRLIFLVRDRATGEEHRIRYPLCLPRELDDLVRDEYKRLATGNPLTLMSASLFNALFEEDYCRNCRWHGPGFEQIHRECRYAGHPVNFELVLE